MGSAPPHPLSCTLEPVRFKAAISAIFRRPIHDGLAQLTTSDGLWSKFRNKGSEETRSGQTRFTENIAPIIGPVKGFAASIYKYIEALLLYV